MITALFVVAAVALALLLIERAVRIRELVKASPAEPAPLDWWDEKQNELVMIHMEDDRTVKGLVAQVSPDGVLLKSPEFLGEGPAIELAGEVFIGRDRIAWTQVPPAARPARRTRKRS